MSSIRGGSATRPREVTWGGTQAVVGSLGALALLLTGAEQLHTSEMRDVLAEAVRNGGAAEAGVTVDTAVTVVRFGILVLGAMSAAATVLGVYVLRRHRGSRLGLTVLGSLVAVPALLAPPYGWLLVVYLATSIGLLWSKAARQWFDGDAPARPSSGMPPPSPPSPPPPTAGPSTPATGDRPPPPPPPPYGSPPPPPPPPPRRSSGRTDHVEASRIGQIRTHPGRRSR